MPEDSFVQNILGVTDLVGSDSNKVAYDDGLEEGVVGYFEDILELKMDDAELLELKEEWEGKSNKYTPNIKARQDKNKKYYLGKQRNLAGNEEQVVPSNLLFEAEETFIPQALSKNPEPVVFSDNTDEGKEESNTVKTMLQYHADVLSLRKKLGMMVRHWSIYFVGVVKHGWNEETNDISLEIRKPQNFVLDPEGYIDEFGDYRGAYLGERIEVSADKLLDMFPKDDIATYVTLKVNAKLGTKVTYTEWWTDKYCFSTFDDIILDKHKNEFFNYGDKEKKDETGLVTQTATPGINHFAIPKMPYTFLSVFSLQEQPHDITNLIEQNIPNQDSINDRDVQIGKNLASAQNGIVISGQAFTVETASQAVQSFYEEGMVLIPDGNMDAIKRIPANPLPSGILESQEIAKNDLRSVFGTQGLSAETPNEDQTARGMILNQQHASSRIGGGVGDALEQVADNIFNWWLQLYCVFYDEPHYAAIMGSGQAVEYISLRTSNLERRFVVSVSPDSMKPRDEVTEMNQAIERWNNKAIDPIGLMKALDEPDPMESAKRLVLWVTNPQAYLMQYFPQEAAQANSANPQIPGGNPQQEPASQPSTLSAPPATGALSAVPIKQGVAQPSI